MLCISCCALEPEQISVEESRKLYSALVAAYVLECKHHTNGESTKKVPVKPFRNRTCNGQNILCLATSSEQCDVIRSRSFFVFFTGKVLSPLDSVCRMRTSKR